MASEKREIGRSFIGILLYQNTNGKLKPTLINKNFNIPPEIIMGQLKLFIKLITKSYYPDFKENTTIIDLDPEE